MAIDKKIPRYLNQDSDYILTDVSEMTDARNIRISSDEGGNSGVIKNVKGNTSIQLAQSLPIGNNRVIGVCENDSENELYFFVWNSNENHTIWKLSPRESPDATLVLQSDALDFYPSSQLHTDVILVNGSIYLYFTDGYSEPKKVNVERAISGGYPSGTTKTQRLVELTVAKHYPKEVSANFETDSSKTFNNLFGRSFQFVAQYVYRDEEYSALGQYSDLYASPNTTDNINRSEARRNVYNKLSLSVEVLEPIDSIKCVNFYVRENAKGTFYFIGEVLRADLVGNVAYFDFYNNGNYPAVADSEFNKLQDSVPSKAQAQTIAGNRLMYANYTEGFDISNVSANIEVIYNPLPLNYSLDVEISPNDVSDTIVNYMDLTNIPAGPQLSEYTLESSSILSQSNYIHSINKSITLETDFGTFTDTNAQVRFNVAEYVSSYVLNISPSTDRADVASKIISLYPNEITVPIDTTNGNYTTDVDDSGNQQSWSIYYSGSAVLESVSQTYIASNPNTIFNGKPVIQFVWRVKSIDVEASKAILTASSDPTDPIGSTFYNVTSSFSFVNTANEPIVVTNLSYQEKNLKYNQVVNLKTFKSHDTHSFGVVYFDYLGRASGVQKIGDVEVAGIHNPIRLGNKGNAEVKVTLTSPIPSGTSYFTIVYDGGKKYNSYTHYSVIEAMVAETANSQLSESNIIYLSIRGLQSKDQSYVEGDGAKLRYTYAEGDKLRLLRYRVSDTEYKYPLDVEFEIVGFVTYDDPVTSPLIPTGQSPTDTTNFRKTGDFLKIKATNYVGFTKSEVENGVDFFSKQVLVEIYSPRNSEVQDSVYYDLNGVIPISQHSQPIYLKNGNAWYNKRNVKQLTWNLTNGVKTSKTLIDIEEFVETNKFSDFHDEPASTKGKPRGVIENEKKITRYASITYSEPYVQDSSRLWLSSFNNSLANWTDYDVMNGGIYGLVNMDQSIMMLQEDKVSIIPLNKQIITTATNNTLVGLSTDFLGNAQYYEGKFGINKNRGAFILAEGDVYIFDVQRGSVYQLGAKGVARISSFGMDSYFEKIGTELTEFETQEIGGSLPNLGGRNLYKINVGHDRQNSEIVVSFVKGVEDLYALIGESYLGITWDYSEPAIAFDYSESKWVSFRDINSDAYANMGNSFYHLKNVSGNFIWLSESDNTYCKFFNTQKTAFFETVFNTAKFNRKVYHALSIDGDSSADVTISTKTQTATLPKAAFQLKEDEYFSSLPRVNGNNEYVALGIVSSKNGNQITFGNRINRMPFRLGGEIFAFASGSYATKSAIIQSVVSANTILVSNGTNINIGDSLVIKGDSSVDGDPLRGSYAKTKFEFSNTDAIEILAVNASVSDSKLHNPNATQQ